MISDDRLDRLVAELPEAIEPGRDLWPEIEAALEPIALPEPPARPRWPLAVAAALLIGLLAGGLAVHLARPGEATPARPQTPALRAERGWQAELALADAELASALEARRGTLDPEVLAVIERNLEVIDIALADTAAALAADPDNARLEAALAEVWRQRIALLERARELPDGS